MKRRPQVIEAEVVEEPTLPARREEAPVALQGEGSAELLEVAMATLAARTQKAYMQDLAMFGKWWETENPLQRLIAFQTPGEARRVVLRYQADMIARGLAKATIARRIRSLNSLVKKLNFAGFVHWRLDVPAGKIEALRDVKGPGLKRWKQLIRSVSTDESWLGVRDLAILRLLGNDNLRASEVGDLRLQDIRTLSDGRTEVYVHGKGGKDLWHPIHSKTRHCLTAWLEIRETREPGKVKWLFLSARNKRLSGKRIWERVRARAADAGIGHLHPHALRHHAITQKAKHWKGSLSALTRWARHSDANMTQRYVDEVADEVYQISQLEDD